ERERRAHRTGSEADPRDADGFELCNRRRAVDGEDVDRPLNTADERRDRLAVANTGDEDTVGAGGKKRLAAVDRNREPRVGRAEPAQKAVGARVDHDADTRLVRGLDDLVNLVELQRERLELR